MTVSSSTLKSRLPRPFLFVLGGCVVLALCVLITCAASVSYWLYARSDVGAPSAQTADVVRTELSVLPVGNANGGEQVFTSTGCRACHSLEPDVRTVGPSLGGIASRAATRKLEYSAEMYIYESIVAPRAFVVPGFNGDVMPAGFKQQLSKQQLADLLAFLMTK